MDHTQRIAVPTMSTCMQGISQAKFQNDFLWRSCPAEVRCISQKQHSQLTPPCFVVCYLAVAIATSQVHEAQNETKFTMTRVKGSPWAKILQAFFTTWSSLSKAWVQRVHPAVREIMKQLKNTSYNSTKWRLLKAAQLDASIRQFITTRFIRNFNPSASNFTSAARSTLVLRRRIPGSQQHHFSMTLASTLAE